MHRQSEEIEALKLKIANCTCGGTGDIPGLYLDPNRLAILADGLEDTDCTYQPLLAHLRREFSPLAATNTFTKHVKGCWALDLLLGKD